MVGAIDRATRLSPNPDWIAARPCIAGDCVWARRGRQGPDFDATPHGRLLRAYFEDIRGLCRCPSWRLSRKV